MIHHLPLSLIIIIIECQIETTEKKMKILKITAVQKDDIAVKKNPEVVPKAYFKAIFQINEATLTATIRTATNHIADCRNEDKQLVGLKEETERKLIEAIRKYNKKLDLY